MGLIIEIFSRRRGTSEKQRGTSEEHDQYLERGEVWARGWRLSYESKNYFGGRLKSWVNPGITQGILRDDVSSR
jgi:hypothetical protein